MNLHFVLGDNVFETYLTIYLFHNAASSDRPPIRFRKQRVMINAGELWRVTQLVFHVLSLSLFFFW